MTANNYISFPQELFDKYNPKTVYFLMWLINKATHSEELGTVYVSINYLSLELDYSPRMVRSIIDLLVNDKVIDKVATKLPTKLATKLTICDFETYITPLRSSRQSSRQSSDKVNDKARASKKDKDKVVKTPDVQCVEDVIVEETTPKTPREIEFDEVVHKPSNEDKLNERKHEFGLSLVPFMQSAENPNGYPPMMIREFFDYWTEPDKLKKKMRHEMQKTWDTARRLRTWANNNINNYGNRLPNNSMAATQQRLDEFLAYRADHNQRQGTADDDEPLF